MSIANARIEKIMDPTVNLRPKDLQRFVGQEKLKNVLSISMAGARARNEAMGHTLFVGPPGLGKTTLANIIALGTNSKLITANGPSITKIPSLATLLNQIDEKTIVFIDEIHRIPRAVEESLYSVMEDFRLDVTTEKMHLNIRMPRFTLVGATTRFGLLTKPLRDRFIHQHGLAFYTLDEIAKIILDNAKTLNLIVEPNAAYEIAKRSKQTPRLANNLLLQSRDFALSFDAHQVSLPIVLGMMEQLEIDANGLGSTDRKILQTIATTFKGGPVGLDAISSVLVEESDVIEVIHEPYLIQERIFVSHRDAGE